MRVIDGGVVLGNALKADDVGENPGVLAPPVFPIEVLLLHAKRDGRRLNSIYFVDGALGRTDRDADAGILVKEARVERIDPILNGLEPVTVEIRPGYDPALKVASHVNIVFGNDWGGIGPHIDPKEANELLDRIGCRLDG